MIELGTDGEALKALGKALGAEADGKKLRRDLAREMRGALQPVVGELKGAARSLPSSGLPHANGEPLRQAVAQQIKAEARLSGRSTGARVKARKKGMPRGFANAPKRLNRAAGWRHQVFGRDVWVQQEGRPGWFDDTVKARAGTVRAAVLRAMEAAAARIKSRAR